MHGSKRDDLGPAIALKAHIRRCLTALIDGTVSMSRRKPAFWAARLDVNAKFWRYPIVTPEIQQACMFLGIDLGDDIGQTSGVYQFSAFLRAVEEPLAEALSGANAAAITVSVPNKFRPDAYSGSPFEALPAIIAPIQAQDLNSISLYLHGSMADLQYAASSDIDDLVIVRRASWQDPSSLLGTATLLANLAREYQNIDPLQHHGHWLLTEFDLLLYDQSYMPLIVLDEAVRVVGERRVECRVYDDPRGFVKSTRHTIRSIEQTLGSALRNGGLNAFELKSLIGDIAILPAYQFQARGEMISKPSAIARAGEMYARPGVKAIEWATMVREKFGDLIRHRPTNLVRAVGKLTYARRQQAESLFKKYSGWASNQHPLGLNPGVVEAISSFVEESTRSIDSLEA